VTYFIRLINGRYLQVFLQEVYFNYKRYRMKLLAVMMCCSVTFSGVAYMKPGEGLKSPQEILEANKLFWQELDTRESVFLQFANDPEGYARDMQKAHDLLIDTLFALHMCSMGVRSNVWMDKWIDQTEEQSGANIPEYAYEIHHYINEMQSWSRDPLRYGKFKGSCPENRREEYSAMRQEEHTRILHDCLFNCEKYQKQLNEDVLSLHSEYIYRKTRLDSMQ